MKIILLTGISTHLLFLTGYLVAADTNNKNLCASSSSTSDQHKNNFECSNCLNPLLDKKEIKKSPVFVYSCGHIEHADCYAGWQNKYGTCPTCRNPGGVTRCDTLEKVARVLQTQAFEERGRLEAATKEIQRLVAQTQKDQGQIAELTRQRDDANARFESLNSRVQQLERNDALFKGTTLVGALGVACLVSFKILADSQSSTRSTR